MILDLDQLPRDVDTLHRIIAEQAGELDAAKAGLVSKAAEIEKLRFQIARLRRQQFGQSSERIARSIDQLELALEELEAEAPAVRQDVEERPSERKRRSSRKPLPAHLPRTDVVHQPGKICTACGGTMHQVGEDVTEILDYIPGRFEVIRHMRPALSCRACEAMVQQPMPTLPIERGRPGPGLLAHVLVSKYADHLPLYRQSGIYARDGVELDRATLADWVGKAARLLRPLVDAVSDHVMAATRLHADDTPVPVLAPGTGKTKTGRLWVYLRDERPHGGRSPPGVFYRYTPDRRGEHPRAHLAGFRGFLQADGYAGFGPLYEAANGQHATVVEVACWAHVRRKFYDVHVATQSPIAEAALHRIGHLFDIEREIVGISPEERRRARENRAAPALRELATFLDGSLRRISGKSELAGAIRYARSRWDALTRYVGDGRLEISNNAAERAIRPLALGRKNYLFAGSDGGGERAAAIYTLIETAKLNDLDPEAYLRQVLSSIASYPAKRVAELLPWNLPRAA